MAQFKNQQAVWQFLSEGGTIVQNTAPRQFKFIDGELMSSYRGQEFKPDYIEHLKHTAFHPKTHWYDALYNTPVLCWVSDVDDPNDCRHPALVIEYTEGEDWPFTTTNCKWKYAIPVTSNDSAIYKD